MSTETRPEPAASGEGAKSDRSLNPLLVFTVVLLLVTMMRGPISAMLSAPALQQWMTVFLAVVTQALPFLVLGVVLSAIIAVFVPPSFFARALPSRPALAVPIAGTAGA